VFFALRRIIEDFFWLFLDGGTLIAKLVRQDNLESLLAPFCGERQI